MSAQKITPLDAACQTFNMKLLVIAAGRESSKAMAEGYFENPLGFKI